MRRGKLTIVAVALAAVAALALTLPESLFAPQAQLTVVRPGVHRFLVEIDGIVTANFESVEGLESEVSVIEYRDGATQETSKFPGITSHSNIVLRYSVTGTQELWNWYRKTMRGDVEKRNMSIVLLSPRGDQTIVRYNITDAWPCAWRGPELEASENEPALEEIELAIGSIERE